jgi:hypothetical protein
MLAGFNIDFDLAYWHSGSSDHLAKEAKCS